LMVYSVAQYRLRESLKELNDSPYAKLAKCT